MDTIETTGTETKETPLKPGYQTTEFWLTLGATVVGLGVASGLVPETGVWAKVVSLVVSVFATMGYTVNRSLMKKG